MKVWRANPIFMAILTLLTLSPVLITARRGSELVIEMDHDRFNELSSLLLEFNDLLKKIGVEGGVSPSLLDKLSKKIPRIEGEGKYLFIRHLKSLIGLSRRLSFLMLGQSNENNCTEYLRILSLNKTIKEMTSLSEFIGNFTVYEKDLSTLTKLTPEVASIILTLDEIKKKVKQELGILMRGASPKGGLIRLEAGHLKVKNYPINLCLFLSKGTPDGAIKLEVDGQTIQYFTSSSWPNGYPKVILTKYIPSRPGLHEAMITYASNNGGNTSSKLWINVQSGLPLSINISDFPRSVNFSEEGIDLKYVVSSASRERFLLELEVNGTIIDSFEIMGGTFYRNVSLDLGSPGKYLFILRAYNSIGESVDLWKGSLTINRITVRLYIDKNITIGYMNGHSLYFLKGSLLSIDGKPVIGRVVRARVFNYQLDSTRTTPNGSFVLPLNGTLLDELAGDSSSVLVIVEFLGDNIYLGARNSTFINLRNSDILSYLVMIIQDNLLLVIVVGLVSIGVAITLMYLRYFRKMRDMPVRLKTDQLANQRALDYDAVDGVRELQRVTGQLGEFSDFIDTISKTYEFMEAGEFDRAISNEFILLLKIAKAKPSTTPRELLNYLKDFEIPNEIINRLEGAIKMLEASRYQGKPMSRSLATRIIIAFRDASLVILLLSRVKRGEHKQS